MRLQDINNALQNIVHINTGLTEERLTLLLTSAGWDEADIKDAVTLWKTGGITKPEYTSGAENSSTASIAENQTNKSEEEKKSDLLPEVYVSHLPEVEKQPFGIVTTSLPPEEKQSGNKNGENKKSFITSLIDSILALFATKPKEVTAPKEKETKAVKQSLSTPRTPKTTHPEELPHNLPLRPYESSAATVDLKEYERRFLPQMESVSLQEAPPIPTVVAPVEQKDPVPEVKKEEKKVQVPTLPDKEKVEEMKENRPLERPIPRVEPMEELYKGRPARIPLDSQDRYVILAAGMLFLVLVLLLGYMYSNGRLG